MSETDSSKHKKKLPIIAFLLPWRSKSNTNLTFFEFIKSRAFTISYLAIIWILVVLLDFGSTRNCGPTWQLAFICEHSVWMLKMYTEPINFVFSMFTATLFHNGLDHILFVTIIGFIFIAQSFEAHNSSLATLFLFFSSFAFVGILMGFIINWGYSNWPEIDYYTFAVERSWMGGSAGFFGIFGALSHNCRKKWLIPFIVILFESINFFILSIDPQISTGHMIATFFGFTVWGFWVQYKKNLIL
jgi:hypothetical protein